MVARPAYLQTHQIQVFLFQALFAIVTRLQTDLVVAAGVVLRPGRHFL